MGVGGLSHHDPTCQCLNRGPSPAFSLNAVQEKNLPPCLQTLPPFPPASLLLLGKDYTRMLGRWEGGRGSTLMMPGPQLGVWEARKGAMD